MWKRAALIAIIVPSQFRGICVPADSRSARPARGLWPSHGSPRKCFVPAFTPASPPSTIPLQLRALREYAARRDWAVAMQGREIGAGTARKDRRDGAPAGHRRCAGLATGSVKAMVQPTNLWDGYFANRSVTDQPQRPQTAPPGLASAI